MRTARRRRRGRGDLDGGDDAATVLGGPARASAGRLRAPRGQPGRGRPALLGGRVDAPRLGAAGPRGRQAREEGRRAAKPARGGRPLLGGGEARAALEGALAERGDATLAELADGLAARTGRRWSPSALCRALKRLGWPRKKRRSGPPSRTARTWPRSAPPGARRSPPAASTRQG